MKIILKQDIKGLGHSGDIINVKPGYGRNFLIPQKKAVLATEIAKKVNDEDRKQKQYKQEKIKTEAQEFANKLASLDIKVSAKVGELGKIFGSVTNIQLLNALENLGIKNINRKSIKIEGGDIKEIGTYKASVKLHRDLTQDIKFEVVEG